MFSLDYLTLFALNSRGVAYILLSVRQNKPRRAKGKDRRRHVVESTEGHKQRFEHLLTDAIGKKESTMKSGTKGS